MRRTGCPVRREREERPRDVVIIRRECEGASPDSEAWIPRAVGAVREQADDGLLARRLVSVMAIDGRGASVTHRRTEDYSSGFVVDASAARARRCSKMEHACSKSRHTLSAITWKLGAMLVIRPRHRACSRKRA